MGTFTMSLTVKIGKKYFSISEVLVSCSLEGHPREVVYLHRRVCETYGVSQCNCSIQRTV